MALVKLDFQVQDKTYKLLREKPDLRERLLQIVAHEEAPHNEYWQGWRCQAVNTSPANVNTLIWAELVSEVYHSRQGSVYRLVSLPDVKAALADTEPSPLPPGPIDVDSMFRYVIGHDPVKMVLRLAISADKPLHALLVGPPGMGKSMLLDEIGDLPDGVHYMGSTTTKAGLVDMLLSTRPKYLVLDEIDKMGAVDMSPLLNLMESGCVTRLRHGSNDQVTLGTRVFAGANSIAQMGQAIKDRFNVLNIAAYTSQQFLDVCVNVLMGREGLGPEVSLCISRACIEYTREVRRVRDVARFAYKDITLLPEIIAALFPAKLYHITQIGMRPFTPPRNMI